MCFRPPEVQKPKRCLACNAMNPFNAQNCRKCNAQFPEVKKAQVKCPRCGTANDFDAIVCTECGITAREAAQLMKQKKIQ